MMMKKQWSVRSWVIGRPLVQVAIAWVVFSGLCIVTADAKEALKNVKRTIVNRHQVHYEDFALERSGEDIGTVGSSSAYPTNLQSRGLVQVVEIRTVQTYDGSGKLIKTDTEQRAINDPKGGFGVEQVWVSNSVEIPPPVLLRMLTHSGPRFTIGKGGGSVSDTYDANGRLTTRSVGISGTTGEEFQRQGPDFVVNIYLFRIRVDELNRIRACSLEIGEGVASGGIPTTIRNGELSGVAYNSLNQVSGYALALVSFPADGVPPPLPSATTYRQIRYNDLGEVVYYEFLEPLGR